MEIKEKTNEKAPEKIVSLSSSFYLIFYHKQMNLFSDILIENIVSLLALKANNR